MYVIMDSVRKRRNSQIIFNDPYLIGVDKIMWCWLR